MAFALTNISNDAFKRKPKCGNVRIISIDGPAGSGKTTLAHHLAHLLNDCPVISMDNLYAGWTHALDDETFHRIIEQIMEPLRLNGTANYQRYDWHEQAFTNWISIPSSECLILEGVGAGHPLLRNFVTLPIWIEAEKKLRLNRVLDRDGHEIRDEMLQWQIDEEKYFKKYKVKDSAEYILSSI